MRQVLMDATGAAGAGACQGRQRACAGLLHMCQLIIKKKQV